MKIGSVKTVAIIVAGGVGSRMKSDIPKQFIDVMGKPVIAYTINAFSKNESISEIIVVTLPEYLVFCGDVVKKFDFKKVTKIVCGGTTRQESVRNGLEEIPEDTDVVAIHDGARPLIDSATISECIKNALEFGCSAPGVKIKDTVKASDDGGFVSHTVNRDNLWLIQTPQVFKKEIINSLHFNSNITIATDDCMLAENAGYKVKIVEGSYENIKITTPQDIYIMKGLLGG